LTFGRMLGLREVLLRILRFLDYRNLAAALHSPNLYPSLLSKPLLRIHR
jgi:hypothetical protein